MVGAGSDARLGRTLRGKWRLDRLLGVGGMASVYAATHRNGAQVAVKVLHPQLSAMEDLRQRFLREGYLANSINHPGVVRVLDDDTDDDGAVFLVMDLLLGETLDNAWQRASRRMALGSALATASQVLDVLAAAHDKGIVHRDVKPENIFLTREGGVRLLDFGVARIREGVTTATVTGALLGTPSFMAPEQALGKTDEIDARTDVWAVGALLYTLLSGQYVHDGATGNQALLSAMTRPAGALAAAAPDIPADVCAIVDRALLTDRAARWQSAREMKAAIDACVSSTALASTSYAAHQPSAPRLMVPTPSPAGFAPMSPPHAQSYGGVPPQQTPPYGGAPAPPQHTSPYGGAPPLPQHTAPYGGAPASPQYAPAYGAVPVAAPSQPGGPPILGAPHPSTQAGMTNSVATVPKSFPLGAVAVGLGLVAMLLSGLGVWLYQAAHKQDASPSATASAPAASVPPADTAAASASASVARLEPAAPDPKPSADPKPARDPKPPSPGVRPPPSGARPGPSAAKSANPLPSSTVPAYDIHDSRR